MEQGILYEVIIIGGSYTGLSAALSLGRSLRWILVIDSGTPCNRFSPFAHNFITNDGLHPEEIREKAREQLLTYPTVSFMNGLVTDLIPQGDRFDIITNDSKTYTCRKVVFATGVTDTLPNIAGFSKCWGISILHCPYCHGYEIKDRKTAVLGNGDMGFELAKIISHWTSSLTLYTNGSSTLSPQEVLLLNKHDITVVQNEIDYLEQKDGQLQQLYFKDMPPEPIEVLFTQLPFIQQCPIPEKLGLKMTEKGLLFISRGMETSIPGIFAAGDCVSLFRAVANAAAMGNKAGALINKCLIDERFLNP